MGRAFEYRRASKEKRWDKTAALFNKCKQAIMTDKGNSFER